MPKLSILELEKNGVVEKFEVSGSGGGGNSYLGLYYDDYSTEEVVIGKWTDGKPIYRKMFEIAKSTLTANTWSVVPISRVDNNIDNIQSAFVYDDSDTYAQAYAVGAQVAKNQTNIYLMLFRNVNISTNKVLLNYTKTTDQPNSFTPQMIIDQFSSETIAPQQATEEEINACLEEV